MKQTAEAPEPADEVVNTASKRGGGPDGKPGKKAKKTKEEKAKRPARASSPEQEIMPAEEQLASSSSAGKKAKKDEEKPVPTVIKPPSQAKVPDQIAAIKLAIKGNDLDDEQVKKFRKLDDGNKLDKGEEISLKELYKQVVYDRGKPSGQKGGGRIQRAY